MHAHAYALLQITVLLLHQYYCYVCTFEYVFTLYLLQQWTV